MESDDEETNDPDFYFSKSKVRTFKVVLLGEPGAGKTSLFLRYKYGSFRKGSTLNGADRYLKEFTNDDGEKVQMVLWDTAGMERMGSLTFHYYHGAHAVLLVYALNDKTTFDSLSTWCDDAARYSPKEVKHFLVATKKDIEKDNIEVAEDRIKSFCKNKNITDSYYTSAKTGEGVEEMFQKVIATLCKSGDPFQNQEDVWALAFQAKPKKKTKCAC